VASGLADVGLGIKFAADVLGLDFVPWLKRSMTCSFFPSTPI